MKILFRIPLTVYFVAWYRQRKLFVLVRKEFDGVGKRIYYWEVV